MGRVKEDWINNLTEEEINLLYEEMVLKGEIFIEEPNEDEKRNIQEDSGTKG
jgi:hypothetical protein